jgi:CheY-like chemotaxis protein
MTTETMNTGTHIILADDDPAIQDSLCLLLERAGYRVSVFATGDPLMEDGFEMPDIFLLDKQLPGVDGLDVCRFLKEQERTKHLPVIVLSASPHIGQLAREALADDFLEKPFKKKDALAMIAKYTAG